MEVKVRLETFKYNDLELKLLCMEHDAFLLSPNNEVMGDFHLDEGSFYEVDMETLAKIVNEHCKQLENYSAKVEKQLKVVENQMIRLTLMKRFKNVIFMIVCFLIVIGAYILWKMSYLDTTVAYIICFICSVSMTSRTISIWLTDNKDSVEKLFNDMFRR